MIIANQLKTKNRAEYLLYMWQVEDIIRLYNCDIDRIDSEYLQRFKQDDETMGQMHRWYGELCEMMRSENKMSAGHLQINENVIIGLADLHQQIFASEKFPYYKQMYYRVLPYIVELRSKRQSNLPSQEVSGSTEDELRLLFEFLYGIMILRLQQKELSEETARASQDCTAFLGQLSDYWNAEKSGNLKLED